MAGAGAVFLFLNVYLDKGLGAQLSDTATLLAIGRLEAVPVALLHWFQVMQSRCTGKPDQRALHGTG